MKLNTTGKNLEITSALEDHMAKKAEKIKSYFPYLLDLQVVFEVVKTDHRIEVTANSEGKTFHCESKTEDMYESIDKVFDKLEKQVKRYKEKISHKKGRPKTSGSDLIEPSKKEVESVIEISKVRQVSPKPKTALEAVLQLSLERTFRFDIFHRGGDEKFRESMALKMDNSLYYIIFPDDKGEWIRRKVKLENEDLVEINVEPFSVNEMSIDKAIEMLNTNGNREDDHLVFFDVENRNYNILYKRKNNTLGLITTGVN